MKYADDRRRPRRMPDRDVLQLDELIHSPPV
jgi:hypothetical protein